MSESGAGVEGLESGLMVRTPCLVVVLSLLTVFASAGFACSSRDGEKASTVPSSSVVTTPSPRPSGSPADSTVSPTTDPRLAARTEAALGIRLTVSAANGVRSQLKLVMEGAALGIPHNQLEQSLQTALDSCELFADRYETRFLLTLDLWPKPYRDLWLERVAACSAISSPDGWDALLRQPDYCQCLLLEFVALAPLTEALDALPDYSDAQLNRAIAERQ